MEKKTGSNIYYGTGKLPKGKKYANMEEAVKAHQARRWGLYKLDPQLLVAKFGPNAKEIKDQYLKLMGEYTKREKMLKNATELQKKLILSEMEAIANDIKKTLKTLEEVKKGGATSRLILDPKKIKQPRKPRVPRKPKGEKKAPVRRIFLKDKPLKTLLKRGDVETIAKQVVKETQKESSERDKAIENNIKNIQKKVNKISNNIK